MYAALLVVKMLPVCLKGNTSNIKLVIDAIKINFFWLSSFKNLNFLNKKAMNATPIITITINPIIVRSGKVRQGQSIIELSICPKSNDVIGLQDLYLQLDMSNVSVTMVDDRISSGNDNSGGNYLVKSSYVDNLVRGNPIYSS